MSYLRFWGEGFELWLQNNGNQFQIAQAKKKKGGGEQLIGSIVKWLIKLKEMLNKQVSENRETRTTQ